MFFNTNLMILIIYNMIEILSLIFYSQSLF
jgi:hypothetical protein